MYMCVYTYMYMYIYWLTPPLSLSSGLLAAPSPPLASVYQDDEDEEDEATLHLGPSQVIIAYL